nr:hypothetical protein Itr_chr12CG27790 [Ipomoea trifida]
MPSLFHSSALRAHWRDKTPFFHAHFLEEKSGLLSSSESESPSWYHSSPWPVHIESSCCFSYWNTTRHHRTCLMAPVHQQGRNLPGVCCFSAFLQNHRRRSSSNGFFSPSRANSPPRSPSLPYEQLLGLLPAKLASYWGMDNGELSPEPLSTSEKYFSVAWRAMQSRNMHG